MDHLVGRRLANVKDGLAFQMSTMNLLTHRRPPLPRWRENPFADARLSSVPAREPSVDMLLVIPGGAVPGEKTARPVLT
jgi:hypothetical protein